MNHVKQKRFLTAFMTKEIFSLIGLLFALLFTVRGIIKLVLFFISCFTSSTVRESINNFETGLLLEALKNQQIAILDLILLILCGFIMLHGILGVYYIIRTDFDICKMFRGKLWFYLQIISAVAAMFIVRAFTGPVGEIGTHTAISWILIILAVFLGTFHIANGFYNACITLGIIVSKRSKQAAKSIELIIAVFSMLQIFLLFL